MVTAADYATNDLSHVQRQRWTPEIPKSTLDIGCGRFQGLDFRFQALPVAAPGPWAILPPLGPDRVRCNCQPARPMQAWRR